MDFVKDPERQVPVYKKVDVVVCGSGSAGLAAAVCAARNGAEVLLVERYPFLGGQTVMAFQNWLGGPTDILTGFAQEFAERLDDRGAAKLLKRYRGQTAETGIKPLTYHVSVEPEEWKYLAYDMAEESGVRVLTNTFACGTLMDENKVKGIIIENKSGRQAVLANVVIDATGDADIAARAGCQMDKPHETGYLMNMVPGIRVGGINFQRIVEYAREHPEEFPPGLGVPPGDFNGENMASVQGISGWFSLFKEGKEKGECPEDLQSINLQVNPLHIKRGMGYLINAHLSQSFKKGILKPWNAEDVTKAEVESIKRARKFVEFLRKRIPGFENCFLIDVSPTVGVQDTRRIVGEYVMTREDIRRGRTFDDDVCLITLTWWDVPVTEYSGWMIHQAVEEMDSEWREVFRKYPRFQVVFGIPYRCLIPKGFDGILVAGQTISMTYMGHEPGPCRGMIPCMHIGQAAGVAASIAAKQGIPLRELSPLTLRKTLESQGVNLRKEAVDLSEVRSMFEAQGIKLIT